MILSVYSKTEYSDEEVDVVKENVIAHGIAADDQYDWFAPNTVSGLTQAGLSHIN